jgi:hypothetical protein
MGRQSLSDLGRVAAENVRLLIPIGSWGILPSRHEDVRAVAHDTEHFSSRRGVAIREGRPPVMPAPDYLEPAGPTAPKRNRYCRRLRPRRSDATSPQTRTICRGRLEHIASPNSCDGAIDYAQEIPVRVITTMLGVAPQSGDLFRR